MSDKGLFWVTRSKRNMKFDVIKDFPVKENTGVVSDQLISLSSASALKAGLKPIRRVVYIDADTGKRYVFITNQMRWSARTVADIYKSRWEVELFFKWIKQNLKIKSVLGHTINAVATQIFVALCVYLLMAYLKFISQSGFSIQAILRVLQMNMFLRRPIEQLLHKRKADPPSPQAAFSLRFA
ncbi:MAG: IS4 family transposase, partial [Hyphomicrobiales bacterium]|nr:IS4 family transposase [Hyphomicrobiales bacterium]